MLNFRNRLLFFMIIVLLQSAISYCKATDGTIIINNQMPAKAVSVIATKSVVLTTGFRAIGTAGSFDAKTGTINSVYPLIPVAAGSTTILAPSLNENAIPVQHCVKTTVPFLAVTDVSQINSGNSLTSLEYTDGLGRTNMTVQKGVTPGKKDLVVVADYDCYGRLSNQWMPTPMVTSTTDPGMVMQQTQNFYADNMPFRRFNSRRE